MDLPNFLTQKNSKEYYWTLVLEPGWVQAGIWMIEGETAEIITKSPVTHWETADDLISASDGALSAAIQNLPENEKEPTKTVFGVPSSWVESGQIKDEYLERIKKICGDLSLEPTGFVVLPEAIAHLIKSEEGTPLNAVVVGVGGENIELSIFKSGNLVGSTVVARSVSVADDVIEGLTRFSAEEEIASRFLLYDGKETELEEVRQNLLNVAWEDVEKVKLLHTPKIEIFSPEKKVLAVSLAGASEIANVNKVVEIKSQFSDDTEENKSLGNVVSPKEEMLPQNLGFVVGGDVAQNNKPTSLAEEFKTPPTHTPNPQTFEPSLPQSPVKVNPLGPILAKLKSFIPKFRLVSPLKNGFNLNIFLYGLIGLTVFALLGFIYWWYVPKATVTLFVSPQKLEETTSVALSSSLPTSIEGKVLSGKGIEVTVNGDKTESTTGKKTIGDKAVGSVKIQNGTAAVINLTSTTILLSSGSLQFTAASTASVSAALSPSEPGTATVEVKAYDIGAQYNLAKDEVFKVANYPKAEVNAIALSDFSGGSSREIAAVSADDVKKIEKDLSDELIAKAKEQIANQTPEDSYFVQDAVETTILTKEYSAKVGDEASTLKLSMEVRVKGTIVSRTDIYSFAKEILKNKVPSGYVLRDDQIDIVFEDLVLKKGDFSGNEVITANLLPEVKTDEIARKISGRSTEGAESYLSSIPGMVRAEIKINPRFPESIRVLPKVAKNINIEISADK